ncbi:MAG TPA: HAD family hydrolase [Burkholderiales bacterium]|nr:HAD family hydrolase [Burkholderiales bacterium]
MPSLAAPQPAPDAVSEGAQLDMQDIYRKARHVRVAIFDVDGVLTDGALYYSDSGAEVKAFNVRDGQGLKMLQAGGVETAIITSRSSPALAQRARDLGIELLFQGVAEKLPACRALLQRLGLEPGAAACIGDDIADLPLLRHCGFAVSVPDAPAVVRRAAHYVTQVGGGRGAARELCELILHAQGALGAQLAAYHLADRAADGKGG